MLKGKKPGPGRGPGQMDRKIYENKRLSGLQIGSEELFKDVILAVFLKPLHRFRNGQRGNFGAADHIAIALIDCIM